MKITPSQKPGKLFLLPYPLLFQKKAISSRKRNHPGAANDNFLERMNSSLGGVSILNGNGKIDINNTLDERLKLLQSDSLPSVRTMLFGKNPNRKFYD